MTDNPIKKTATAAVTDFLEEHLKAIGYVIPLPGEAQNRPEMVRAHEGELLSRPDANGEKALNVADAMEIRLFDEKAELRWTSEQGDRDALGWAFTLDEAEAETRGWCALSKDAKTPSSDHSHKSVPGHGARADNSAYDTKVSGNHRLLWGQIADIQGEWVLMAEARIGEFWAPVSLGKPPTNRGEVEKENYYAAFVVQEYQAQDDYGNWYIADERYTGIKALPKFAVELKLSDSNSENNQEME